MVNVPMLILLLGVLAGMVWFVLSVAQGRIPLAKVTTVVALVLGVGAAVVTVLSLIDPLLNDRTTVAIPLTPFQPHPAPGITLHGMTATIVGGGVDRATLTLTGLSVLAKLLVVSSWVLQGATWVAVCFVVLRLARSLDQGDIFRNGAQALTRVAGIVTVSGLLAAVLADLGAWRAGSEALEHHGGGAEGTIIALDPFDNLAQYGWPDPYGPLINLPFWPLIAGLGLALIAAAFRAGHTLRQDTQGLV